jgi:hypothetical protein
LLKFPEWFYFFTLSFLVLYLATFEKDVSNGKVIDEDNKLMSLANRDTRFKKTSAVISPTFETPTSPTSPYIRFSPKIPLNHLDSEATLVNDRSLVVQSRIPLTNSNGNKHKFLWIVHIISAILGLGTIAAFAVDSILIRGPLIGIPSCLMAVFSVAIFSQVGLGAFNQADGPSSMFSKPTSIIISILLIIPIVLGIVLSPLGFYISFGLWPYTTLICLASTSRKVYRNDVKVQGKPFSKKVKGKRRVENTEPTDIEQEDLRKSLVDRRNVIRRNRRNNIPYLLQVFLVNLNICLITAAILISLACGFNLPISVSVSLIALCSITGASRNVGRVVGAIIFWIASIVFLFVLVVIAVLPIYAFPRGGRGLNAPVAVVLDIGAITSLEQILSVNMSAIGGFFIGQQVCAKSEKIKQANNL